MNLLGTQPLGGTRFRIRGRLGAGSMGIVYEAHDRERDEIVALKTLLNAEANALYRFKREFRALADIHHRNLVALHELWVDEQQCFFTMERVVGCTFLEYVRPEHGPSIDDPTFEGFDPENDTGELTGTHAPAPRLAAPGPGTVDLTRLRSALGQLADGVVALHQAGIVHRDLKPGNVMVNEEGRVVILDFGLATELTKPLAPGGAQEHEDDGLTGTAAYMAPEQVTHGRGVAASDWYAVGVMLYEALSGTRPYTGALLAVLLAKRTHDPPPLAQVAPDAPHDLTLLCEMLMRRDPDARPDDAEVLRLLGRVGPDAGASGSGAIPRGSEATTLVGRVAHLQALRDAFAATARGQAVSMYVHGPSGTGKSALVRGFLAELSAQDPRPVILSGRCHLRESVPYKALDPVVDSLSRFLVAMPEDQARVLMPRDLWALARLFPVMQTVVDELHGRGPAAVVIDQVELRRRAFAALRDLLGRLADRRRVVITIDDLQWADADSVTLLEGLLRPPDAPALLLIASFRSEEIEHQAFLRELLAHTGTPARRGLAVGPLAPGEVRRLLFDLLGDPEAALPFIDTIVRESAGSPFLAEQLAHYVSHEPGVGATGIGLAEVIDAQIRRQAPEARPLLDLLAVAAHPIRPAVAFRAAGLGGDERPLVNSLRTAKLVRLTAGRDQLELYHDRIRETLAAQVGPDRRPAIHRALAEALVASGADDPEVLFVHHHAAGQLEAARSAAVRAALKAAGALAFDQCAQFYRRALDLGDDLRHTPGPHTDTASVTSRARLEEGLADALANAGRCEPAAAAYQRAASFHQGPKALDLTRLAAEQLLVSGHHAEGRVVLQGVLAQVGLQLAPTPRRALLSLIKRRLQLKLHGMRFTLRPESEVPPEDLMLIDICTVVSMGLSMNDNIRAAGFQSYGTLVALKAGEPIRLSRALGMEASLVASAGASARTQALRLSQAALDLAHQVGSPAAIASALLHAGACAYLAGGEWKRAARLCSEGEAIFREKVAGSTWAKTTIRRFWLGSLMYLGELAELRRRLGEFLGDARDRGNLYALTDMRARLNLAWLIADEPAEGRRQLADAMSSWPTDGYHVQHFNALLSRVQADLYEGDPAAAVPRIEAVWPALTGSLLMRIQLVRTEAHQLRARAALATLAALAAAGRPPTRDAVKAIEREVEVLAKEKTPWIDPLAELLRAGLHRVQGRPDAAIEPLRRAIRSFRAQDMALYAAVAERQLGLLIGGDEGTRLRADAESWMAAQTVRDPAAIARVFAPGLE